MRAHGVAAAVYNVRALQRGDHRIGNVYLRVQSPLEMAERWYVAPVAHVLRIYPNLEAAKRNTIYLMRSRQIELEKRRLRVRGAPGRASRWGPPAPHASAASAA